jgi:hypothetical protein
MRGAPAVSVMASSLMILRPYDKLSANQRNMATFTEYNSAEAAAAA